MFLRIWEERPHFSEVSGKPLLPMGAEMWHWQFAHILPKGAYPRYKLNPDNIILLTPDEHYAYDHATHTLYDKVTGHVHDQKWQALFSKAEVLRQSYFRSR